MKTRTRGGSYPPTLADLVKREDTARRASLRAEARLSNDFTQAGGIDGAKRNSLYAYKREREHIRQELHNLKSSHKRNNTVMMQSPGILKIANPQLAEEIEEERLNGSLYGTRENSNGTRKNYGRNYFGYKSEPGSNKPHFEDIKAIQEKYSPVKNYYEYKGPKQMDKRTREKLALQQKRNMDVQERVKSFAAKDKKNRGDKNLNGYSVVPPTGPSTTKEIIPAKEEKLEKVETLYGMPLTNGNTIHDKEVEKKTSEPEFVGLRRARKNPTATKDQFSAPKTVNELNLQRASEYNEKMTSSNLPQLKEEKEDGETEYTEPPRRTSRVRVTSPTYSRQNTTDTSSVVGSLTSHPPYRVMKPKTALDLVFDADKYAPDGRLRTVHCMPDVNKAYKEARQARYIRTRYRRELEKELTVNEMFDR